MERILKTNLLDLQKKYRPVYLNPLFFNFDKRKFPVVRREDMFKSYFDYIKYMPDEDSLVFFMIYLNNKKVSYSCNDHQIRELSLVKIGCSKFFIKEDEKDIYKFLRNTYGDFEVIFILKTENKSLGELIYKKLEELQLLYINNEKLGSKDLILFDTEYGLGEEFIKMFINISAGVYNEVRLNILSQLFHHYYIENKNC